MLTAKQAFKVGFLASCRERGLGPQAAAEHAAKLLEKSASPKGWFDPSGWSDAAQFWTTTAPMATLVGGAGVAGAAGFGTGAALGSLETEDVDPEEVKRQKLIETYRQQAERIKRQNQSYRMRAAAVEPKPLGSASDDPEDVS